MQRWKFQFNDAEQRFLVGFQSMLILRLQKNLTKLETVPVFPRKIDGYNAVLDPGSTSEACNLRGHWLGSSFYLDQVQEFLKILLPVVVSILKTRTGSGVAGGGGRRRMPPSRPDTFF